MATIVSNLSLNTSAAQARLASIYNQASALFGKKGVGLNVNVRNTGLPLGVISRDVSQFDKSLEAATSRIIAFTSTIAILRGVGAAMTRLVRDSIEVEKAITGIQSILGATSGDLKNFTNSLFDIANKTGVGFFEAAEAANEFARQGLTLNKTLVATQAALSVVRVSGGDIKQIIEGITASVNAFESQSVTFTEVADKLAALDAAFSTSASGLIEGFKRVASVASEAGVSIDELGAIFASVKQISGRSESVIGNGLKTIITNLQNSSVQEKLEAIGVATKNAAGEFRPVVEVVRELSVAFEQLSDSAKADLSQKIAGKFQINTFKSLIAAVKPGGQFDRGLGVSQNADGDISKRIETLNQTTATRIQQLDNNITNLRSTLGDAFRKELFDGLLDAANRSVEILKETFSDGSIGQSLASGILGGFKGPGITLAIAALFSLIRKTAIQSGGILKNILGLGDSARTLDLLKRQDILLKSQLATTKQIRAERSSLNSKILDRGTLKSQIDARRSVGDRAGAAALSAEQRALRAALRDTNARDAAIAQTRINAQKQIDKSRKADESRNKLTQRAFGISIAGGLAGEAIGGRAGRNVSEISSAVGTSALLASFGKLGGVLGIITGTFSALDIVTKNLRGNLEDVLAAATEEIAQINKRGGAEQNYVDSLKNYEESLTSGSVIQIRKSSDDLDLAIQGLTGSSRDLITAQRDNLDSLLLSKQASQNRAKSGQAALGELTALSGKTYNDALDKYSLGIFGQKTPSRQDSKPLVDSIINTIDFKSLSAETFSGIEKSLDSYIKSGDSSALVNSVQSLITDSGASDAINRFSDLFKNGRETISRYITSQVLQTKLTRDFANETTKSTLNLSKMNKSFDLIVTSRFFEQKLAQEQQLFGFGQQASSIDRAIGNSGTSDEQRSFLSFQSDVAKLQIDTLSKVNDAEKEYNDQVQQRLGQISGPENRNKALDISSKIASGQLSGLALDREVQILVKGLGDSGETAIDFSAFLVEAQNKTRKAQQDQENALKSLTAVFEDNAKQIKKNKLGNLFGDITKTRVTDDVSTITKGDDAARKLLGFSVLNTDPRKFSTNPEISRQARRDELDAKASLARDILAAEDAKKRIGIESKTPTSTIFEANKILGDQAISDIGKRFEALLKPLKLNSFNSNKAQDLLEGGNLKGPGGLESLIYDLTKNDNSKTLDASAIFNFLDEQQKLLDNLSGSTEEKTNQQLESTDRLIGVNEILSENIKKLTEAVAATVNDKITGFGKNTSDTSDANIKKQNDNLAALTALKEERARLQIDLENAQKKKTADEQRRFNFTNSFDRIGVTRDPYSRSMDSLVAGLSNYNGPSDSAFNREQIRNRIEASSGSKSLVTQEEAQSMKDFVEKYLAEKRGDPGRELNQALVDQFGKVKASAVIQSGALNEVRKGGFDQKSTDELIKSLKQALKESAERESKLNTNPELTTAVNNLTTAMTSTQAAASFSVDVNGVSQSFIEIVQSEFPKLFERAFSQATGKSPKIIPAALA